MTTMPQYKDFAVSWEEIHRNARALAWRLVDKGPWTGIVAVTRGGLIPSYVIARELDIKLIETICISNYDHKDSHEAQVIRKPQIDGGGKGWLVVDDICDTGKTFQIVKHLLPDAHYAALYVKPQGAPLTDTFIGELSQDTWIFFPWYMESKYAEPIVSAPRD